MGPVADPRIEALSAITLATRDMAASVAWYEGMGFERLYGGPEAAFTSFGAGSSYVNLQLVDAWAPPAVGWGRAIVWVDDVDAACRRARALGGPVDGEPTDAPWGERYVHVLDPSGHELSFA